ncbi:MAG: ABC transporter permease [Lachnospiraceae bacterium]
MNLGKIKTFLSRNTIIPIWIIFIVLAAIFVNGFLGINNLFNVFNQNAMKGIMAIGMTFVILTGYFDMSVCTTVGLTAALVCGLQENLGLLPALLIALAAGLLVGSINGLLVAYAGMNAFVVTLAMMLGVRGIAYIYHAESSMIAPSEAFKSFGSGRLGLLSYSSLLFILLLLLAFYVLKYTRHGRNTYATGGNETTAFNAGIKTKRIILLNFMICGFAGGLGGVLYAASVGASTPSLGWPDIHMLVIAAVVLGGTKLTGGSGSIWYTLGGVMLLGGVDNIMNLLNTQTYFKTMVTGLIMIGVLYLDRVLTNKRHEKLNLEA